MAKKNEIQLTKEDIADLIRTKHRVLARRRVRRAINEELHEALAAIDRKVQKGWLPEAPKADKLDG